MDGKIEKKRDEKKFKRALSKAGVDISEAPILNHRFFQEPSSELMEGMSPPVRRFISNTVEGCRNYLMGTYIRDPFLSKQERDDWEQKMQKKFGDAFDKRNDRSKLRRSLIQQVITNIDAVAYFLNQPNNAGIQTPLAEAIRCLHEELPDHSLDNYELKTYLEKLDFEKRIKEIAMRFLLLVIKPEEKTE